MPCSYVIDKERRLVVSTAWGRLTLKEMQAHRDQLGNDPDFSREFDQLGDFTAVTTPDVSVQEARAFASSTVFSATSRRAFVAPSPTIFGMLRLWETYQEFSQTPTQARIFHDLASALKWLGLEGLPYVTKADAKDAAAAKAPKNEKTG